MDIDTLYASYGILSEAGDKVSEHTKEFKDAIAASKGGEKEKQLGAQIIAKFFKHFPVLQVKAMQAVFDLCQDDDSAIRIAAMKTLPSFVKDSKKLLSKVTEFAVSLLQVNDPQESTHVSNTLGQILREDPINVLQSMFITASEQLSLREKLFRFIITKVKLLDASPELDNLMIEQIKGALAACISADEFILLITYLTTSKHAKTFSGQREIIDIVSEKIEMEGPFEPSKPNDNVTDKLITCVKFIMPFFSAMVDSTKFIIYYCDQVLPQWEAVGALPDGKQYQLALVQQLAQMSTHCGKLESPSVQIVQLFDKLKSYMPEPPEDLNSTEMPFLNFTVVECLLYAFHRLAAQSPDFLTCDDLVLRDFRSRLMYFSRGVQGCQKVLGLSGKEKVFSPEEKKIREISPKLLNNINSLIKDLFYRPPIYKTIVQLSFLIPVKKEFPKKADVPVVKQQATKRHVPITFDGANNKQARLNNRNVGGEKKLYTPPSGKFSNNFHGDNRRGRFQRGGGGAQRGGIRNRGKTTYRSSY